jgi:hypothetical protein
LPSGFVMSVKAPRGLTHGKEVARPGAVGGQDRRRLARAAGQACGSPCRGLGDQQQGLDPGTESAGAQYLRRWEVFGVEGVAWRGPGCSVRGEYPVVDDGYNGAMDASDDADHERGEAAIALDRELCSVVPGGQTRGG